MKIIKYILESNYIHIYVKNNLIMASLMSIVYFYTFINYENI